MDSEKKESAFTKKEKVKIYCFSNNNNFCISILEKLTIYSNIEGSEIN